MNRRRLLAFFPAVSCALALPRALFAEGLRADAIFTHAKDAWRARTEAPFVTFALRERYDWRGKTHDNWWQVSYRDADRALALRREIVPADEAQRLRGAAIALNFHWHHGTGHADTVDTNGDADAFPILDPLIEPNASFGLLHHEQTAELVGAGALSSPSPHARETPAPQATSEGPSDEMPLRVLARVEAVSRDYTIAFAGLERVRDTDAYHLTLTPVRSPNVNRLRDLWVDATTFETLQLAVHGLFEGKPYDDARWIVTYVKLDGRTYVQQIKTDDSLRFGMDRFVAGLQYDFVGYDFPAAISPLTFERLL